MKAKRRDILKLIGLAFAFSLLHTELLRAASRVPIRSDKPNIIYLLADDLGYAELGCYGQTKIKTPHIDRLAAEGMRFLQHYSGSPVCAPSRCTLMTGLHTGHAQVRGNKQIGGKEGWRLGSTKGGQWPLEDGTVTIAKVLQDAGYVTGAFGKWGLGTVGSTGDPQKQGFDHFYGYICQRQAHTFYPNHLWRDGMVEPISANRDGAEQVYSHDLIANEALAFIAANRDRPFFCYVPFTIPHVAIQVPEDSLAQYRGKWPDPPYDGSKGYFPHPSPRAGYAAMVSRMDRDVGRIMDLLDTLNLKEKTLVVFTSDNGPTFNGGSDSAFFASAGPLRGLKTMVYEGGIRVPFIARWPGKIEPGSISHHVSAFWDFFPTCCDLLGVKALEPLDGISMLPALTGQPGQQQHDYLYWELNGQQALRVGDYKAVRRKRGPIELYDLQNDIGEQQDLAADHPAIVAKMKRLFESVRNESSVFPLVRPKKNAG